MFGIANQVRNVLQSNSSFRLITVKSHVAGIQGAGRLYGENCGCVAAGPILRQLRTSSWNPVKESGATAGAAKAEAKSKDEDEVVKSTPINESVATEPETGQVFHHPRYNMYVCWHPEVPFPYEMTRPIDLNAPVTDSHLKIQALPSVKEAFRPKHNKVTVSELVKLTYSTKHRFYGQFGKRKRLVYRDMDPNKEKRNREYL